MTRPGDAAQPPVHVGTSGWRRGTALRAPGHGSVRLHGPDPKHLYGGSYSDADLGWWADRIHDWQRLGHAVFAYFNNDGGGHAVRNAWTLRDRLQA